MEIHAKSQHSQSSLVLNGIGDEDNIAYLDSWDSEFVTLEETGL
jgi:hypothetical protein